MPLFEEKLIEIRDSGTCIVAIALKPTGHETDRERRFFARAGFGRMPESHTGYILFGDMDGGEWALTSDPFKQPNNTLKDAHWYLREHWDELETGAVVDVRVIRGWTDTPAPTDLGEY